MFAKLHPLGRCGEIKEVVDSIIFLASANSSFITGQLMAIGGGCQLEGVSFYRFIMRDKIRIMQFVLKE